LFIGWLPPAVKFNGADGRQFRIDMNHRNARTGQRGLVLISPAEQTGHFATTPEAGDFSH
jgi:hypothetical protein